MKKPGLNWYLKFARYVVQGNLSLKGKSDFKRIERFEVTNRGVEHGGYCMVFHYYSLSIHLICAVSVFNFLTTFNKPNSVLDNIGLCELAKVHVSL